MPRWCVRDQMVKTRCARRRRIATGWRLKEVQPPLIVCTHAQTPQEILAEKTIPEEDLEKCREIGAALAAGMAMGVF